MKLNRLNLVTALVSLAAALVWILIGQTAAGMIWLVCSLVWVVLALAGLRSSEYEPSPARRLARRLSRMLLWS